MAETIIESIDNKLDSFSGVPGKRGRPSSNNINCKLCGELLVLGVNARETSKGSKRPRPKCKKCENKGRYQRKYPKPAKLTFNDGSRKIIVNISSVPDKHLNVIYYERTNPYGMRFETTEPYRDKVIVEEELENSSVTYDKYVTYYKYKDVTCDECGGTIRYDEHHEPVCEDCGLVFYNSEINFNEKLSNYIEGSQTLNGWQGAEMASWERRRYPQVKVNRDSEHERVLSDDHEYNDFVFQTFSSKKYMANRGRLHWGFQV